MNTTETNEPQGSIIELVKWQKEDREKRSLLIIAGDRDEDKIQGTVLGNHIAFLEVVAAVLLEDEENISLLKEAIALAESFMGKERKKGSFL